MKTSTKQSVERTFLALERNALSEERTLLAYIRTELAFIGVVILILRFYFEQDVWSIPVALALSIFFGALVLVETVKIKKIRRERRRLQKKHKGI
jgi:uncharacterized membrane protein YidH (DUF202 family)